MGLMRTFFNIVLGILFTVVKACLHALAYVGMVAVSALLLVATVYLFLRLSAAKRRSVKTAEWMSIDR